MMTSQNWQINVIYLVENCLSYNISKFGRKPMTGKWDNLNWTKDVWRHEWNRFDALARVRRNAYGNVDCYHVQIT